MASSTPARVMVDRITGYFTGTAALRAGGQIAGWTLSRRISRRGTGGYWPYMPEESSPDMYARFCFLRGGNLRLLRAALILTLVRQVSEVTQTRENAQGQEDLPMLND